MLSTGNTIMKPMSEAEFEFYVHAQKNISQGFFFSCFCFDFQVFVC